MNFPNGLCHRKHLKEVYLIPVAARGRHWRPVAARGRPWPPVAACRRLMVVYLQNSSELQSGTTWVPLGRTEILISANEATSRELSHRDGLKDTCFHGVFSWFVAET